MLFYMLWKRKVDGHHKLHRLMHSGKFWSLANFKTLALRGCPFTWNNKRPGEANTKIQLDSGVSNEAWLRKFSLSKVTHLSAHASDHLPLLLQVQPFNHQWQRKEKSFKFEESRLLKADCEATMKEAWGRDTTAPHGLESIKQRIQTCGAKLLSWGLAWTDLDVKAIKKTQKRLDQLNEEEISETSKAEFLDLSKKMDELLQKQEIYWAQRYRVSWLKHDDKDTKKFSLQSYTKKEEESHQGY